MRRLVRLLVLVSASHALHAPAIGRALPALARRVPPPVAVSSPPKLPKKSDLPTPTEEGGFLARLLPFSLLLESQEADRSNDPMVGEDAAVYRWADEKWGDMAVLPSSATGVAEAGKDWSQFFLAVGTILSALAVLWVYSPTGYGDDFLAFLESICGGNPHLVTLCFGLLFPVVHSGLASLRPWARKYTGERLWRVIFAWPSLCLAYSWIVYYIDHCHAGMQLWSLQPDPLAHALAWTISFASFFFLYPTVFNLKEVAAIDKPRIHLWETGIIRITRHPQAVGQCMWSFAHCMMVGTSFALLTNALLVGHHLFACWNGDRRLHDEHGDAFLEVKSRTSTVPFAAIVDGRQTLPKDYYKELVRAPYALIAAGTLGAYFAHPYMQAGAALVRNTGLVEGGILDGLFQ